MRRLTECEELFDRCAELARDNLGLLDVLAIAAVVALLVGAWLALRRLPARKDPDDLNLHSRYEEKVQDLQALKSGRLWGDLAQAEPEEVLPPH